MASIHEQLFEAVLAGADATQLARLLFEQLPGSLQADFLAGQLESLRPDVSAEALEATLREQLDSFVSQAREGAFVDGTTLWDERFAALLAGHHLLSQLGQHLAAVTGFSRLFDLLRDSEFDKKLFPEDNPSQRLGARLPRYLRDYLTSLLAEGGSLIAAVDRAVGLVDYGGVELIGDMLPRDPQLIAALERRSEEAEISHYRQSLYVGLAQLLLASGDDRQAYKALLERQVGRFPRLLDPLIQLARANQDWPLLLDLAQRGLTLREDRHRYNQLASEALEALGRSLP